MKIEAIDIHGFWGYRNRESVSLEGLPLVIGVGENGSGKSALLVHAVLVAFYGKFPTNTIEESITTGAETGTVTIEFRLSGALYQVTRTYPRTGAATASVMVEDPTSPAGWRVITEKGVREVTAKMTELLGMDYKTATMTWVAEQGQYGRFSSALPSKRFELLSGVFGLDGYAKKASAAAKKLRTAEEEVAHLDGRIVEMSDGLVDDDMEKDLTGLPALSDVDLEAAKAAQEAVVDSVAERLAALESSDPAAAAVQARRLYDSVRQTREQKLGAAQVNVTRAGALVDQARARAHQARTDAETRRGQAFGAAANRAADAEQRSASRVRTAEAALEVIGRAEIALPNLVVERDGLLAAAGELQGPAGELTARIDEANASLVALRANFASHQDQISSIEARILKLQETVQNTSDHAQCYACGQHLSAEDATALITGQLAEIASHVEAQNTINQTGAGIAGQVAQMTAERDGLLTQVAEKTEAATQLTRKVDYGFQLVASKPAQEAELEAANRDVVDARAAELRDRELAETEYQATVDRAAADEQAQVTAASAEFESQSAVVAELINGTDEEVELEHLAAIAERTAATAGPQVAAARTALVAERDAARVQLTAIVGEAARRVNVAAARKEQEGRLVTARAALAAAKSDRDVHAALVKAYSPTGIPAMILTGVVDSLNEVINASLARLSAGELALQLRTSRETGSGNVENKVTVYVETPDGVRAYESLSGGQKFRVDVAIRAGLSQVIARGTGTPIETFILDEGWGTLDEKGIRSTVDTLHRLSETTNVITVSHIDAVRDAFASRIEVSINEGTSVAKVIR